MKIPEGISVAVEGKMLIIRGPKGEVKKRISGPDLKIEVAGDEVNVICPDVAIQRTWESVLKNAFKGVEEMYEKKLKMLHAHFPFTVEVKGDKVYFNNFLGEKVPRKARIMEGVEVKVKGREIIIRGCDKEMVGQTAANLRQALKIRNRDPRIFQDGLYPA